MDTAKLARSLPLIAIAAPAFVATWSGWVGLGEKAGFGLVEPLPGIADNFEINTAITLPLGIEAYAAYALGVWLSNRPMEAGTRRFAMWSGLVSLLLGALGQVAFHLLEANGRAVAPSFVVVCVACLPIAIVGMSAALWHMLHANDERTVKKPSRSTRTPAAPRETTTPAASASLAAGEPAASAAHPSIPAAEAATPKSNVREIHPGQMTLKAKGKEWFLAQVAEGRDPNTVKPVEVDRAIGATEGYTKKHIQNWRDELAAQAAVNQ